MLLLMVWAWLLFQMTASRYLDNEKLMRLLEDWCQPLPGFFLYYPNRRNQPAALTALINILRLRSE